MKHVRNLCAAVVLLFVLSLSTRAGEITIWGIAPPPPPPPPESATSTAQGEMTTWGAANSVQAETLVAVLQLLSVF
jgi:hypothetical protein